MAPIHILKLMKFDDLSPTDKNHLKRVKESLQQRRRELDQAIKHVDRGLKKGRKRKRKHK
jgi:hypothetical protein